METIESGKPLLAREWYFVGASFDAGTGEVRLYQEPLVSYAKVDTASTSTQASKGKLKHATGAPLIFAAHLSDNSNGRMAVTGHYNGKIERPRLANRAFSRIEMEQIRGDIIPFSLQNAVVAAWDFSKEMTTEKIVDASRQSLPRRDLPASGPRHDRLELDRRRDVLAPQAGAVWRDPLPR